MKTAYETTGWFKDANEDIYADGCRLEGGYACDGNDTFKADTVDDLIGQIMSFVGCEDRDSVLLDSCEEPGRIDIQIMETDDGFLATESDLATWKQGRKRLWLVCYTFHVEKVTRETVSLTQKG